MHLFKFDPGRFEREYGELTQRIAPSAALPALPFGAMWSVLEPGESSSRDNHHEAEMFFVVEGRGIAAVNGDRREITAGDAVFVPPFSSHSVSNPAAGGALRCLAVWWQDPALLAAAGGAPEPSRGPRVLLTATPPTVNGELHLGHISGPYLAADVCRRYLRMRGRDVFYVSGSDENQSYVVIKAGQKGWTPVETAERFGDRIEDALRSLDAVPDLWARPSTSPHHARFCQEFFARLHAAGAFVERTRPSLHCERCDRYLFEAHVSGKCPHCGHGSDGCACEDCARPNDCADLVDPRCAHCGGAPVVRETTRLYFPLAAYEKELRAYLRTISMTPHMASLCETMLAEGLPEIAVSHLSDWGIPVPVPGFEGQVIYVWMEMCPGYLAATQQLADGTGSLAGWRDLWGAGETCEIYQFFGFDNGYFHALLFPALLMAYDREVRLPDGFVTNEFYLLEGQKFSSSREHAIWATDFAAREPVDAIRFFLSLDRPEHRRTSFTLPDYRRTIDEELAGGWQTWLRKLGERVLGELDGKAPGTGTYTPVQETFFRTLGTLRQRVEAAYDPRSFSPAQAAAALCELVRLCRRFDEAESYLSGVAGRREQRKTALALELLAARLLAMAAAPLLPGLSSRIWSALGFPAGGPAEWEDFPAFVPQDQKVGGLARIELLAR